MSVSVSTPSAPVRESLSAETPAAAGLSIEHLECTLDLTYNWGYEQTRKDLRDLYTRAKRSQWIPEETLPWDTVVDIEHPHFTPEFHPLYQTPLLARLTPDEDRRLTLELSSWLLSQF